MDYLISKFRKLIGTLDFPFVRGQAERIHWKSRGIQIEGPRGVGKSTLMLQQIKRNLPIEQSLYVSLDDLYFRTHSLVSVAEDLHKQGLRHLYVDEVHKYHGWQQEIKNLYDFLPDLQLVVSGSSIIILQQSEADLSRRLARYQLPILSFREYLALHHGLTFPALTLDQILNDHSTLTESLNKEIYLVLQKYRHYQEYGAFPFSKESEADYALRLNQLINVIIDYDLTEARPLESASLAKLKKLLYIISTAVPFKPNIQKLTNALSTSRNKLLEMLDMLEKSKLIRNLRSSVHGVSLLNKPDKIYLHNTNYIHALAEEKPNLGNLRETLFLSHLQDAGIVVTHSTKTDFEVAGKYHVEVGGKDKGYGQLNGLKNSFIVADDIERGFKNKIPLWLFGFLY
jgi:hypothetical protein